MSRKTKRDALRSLLKPFPEHSLMYSPLGEPPLVRRGATIRLVVGSRVAGIAEEPTIEAAGTGDGFVLMSARWANYGVAWKGIIYLEDSLDGDVVWYPLQPNEDGRIWWRECPGGVASLGFALDENEFQRRLQDAIKKRWGRP